jgi:hypothetical protein
MPMILARIADQGPVWVSAEVHLNHVPGGRNKEADVFPIFQDGNLPMSGHHMN